MFDPRNRPRGLDTVPGWVLVANVVGVCVFVAVGLHMYFGDHMAVGLLFVAWAVVVIPIGWWYKLRSGRRVYDATRRGDDLTGNVLAPQVQSGGASALSAASRWIGAADMPTPFGRVTTTYQVAVLEIVDATLVLRLRPEALMNLVLRVESVRLRAAEIEAVFPARARLRIPAIGIRPVDGPPAYFVTAIGRFRWYFGPIRGDRAAILSAIESAGFPVTWEERRYSRA